MTFIKRTGLQEGDPCRIRGTITKSNKSVQLDVQGTLLRIRHNDCIVLLQEPIIESDIPIYQIAVRKGIIFRTAEEKSKSLPAAAEYICNQLCRYKNVTRKEEVLDRQCHKCRLSYFLDLIAESV